MKLGKAANYFSTTPVDGWNGTGWNKAATTVTLDPYDRFISEREFGNKRRMLLVRPDDKIFDLYSVIRLPSGDVYMVGSVNSDIQGDEYSRVFLVHRAQYFGTLYEFTKTTKASGMPGAVTRHAIGTYWCDTERVTVSNSKEFDNVSFSQMTITLPRDCPADTDHELLADGKYLTISESVPSSGFRVCRGIAKRSS